MRYVIPIACVIVIAIAIVLLASGTPVVGVG